MSIESILVRLRMTGGRETERDSRRVARGFDEMGDKARKAAREMFQMSAASSTTRLNFGPFSTSVRFAAIGVGALANGLPGAVTGVLGLAEAIGTTGLAGGAAGGVGLLALGQGAAVAALGFNDFTKALGGNAEAMKRLGPQAAMLTTTLSTYQQQLHDTVDAGLFPGLTAGSNAALRNFQVVNGIVRDTSRELGSLAQRGGQMIGSAAWGRDLQTVGSANVQIIHQLGDGALHLADAFRHVAVEAAPLAVWLSEQANRGATVVDRWFGDKRRTGELAKFFRDAREDITIIGSIGGHTGRGLLNLFGAQDVDGTNTLRSIDRITARFEQWTSGPALAHGLGQALVDELPHVTGALADALAETVVKAVPRAASLFWQTFWDAGASGKALIGLGVFMKSGAFSKIGGALFEAIFRSGGGGKGGGPGGLLGRGSTPANPLFVFAVNEIPGAPGAPGKPPWAPPSTWPPPAPGGGRGGIGSILRKVGPAALRAPGAAIGAAGITAVALGYAAQQHNRGRGGGSTDIQRYGQVSPEYAARQAAATAGIPLEITLHSHISMDSQPVYKGVSRQNANALARRGG